MLGYVADISDFYCYVQLFVCTSTNHSQCKACAHLGVNYSGEGMLSHSGPYNLHKAIIKPGYFRQMEEDRVIMALLSEVDLAPGKVLSAQTERGSCF